jgi:adenylate cyclase
VLTERVRTNGGRLVKTLGDGMVCQFKEPDGAFRAACEMQVAAVDAEPGPDPKLSIKVGFTWGPVVSEGGDVFGDTVNVCARLVALANPNQVLTTQETVEGLSPGLRERCRHLYPLKVRGRVTEVKVCDVLWRAGDADITKAFTRSGLQAAAKATARKWILKVTYAGNTTVVESSASVKLGRDDTNDVVINSSLASRVHARIYGRGDKFVIADQSSNGTFVMIDGNTRELRLRREEATLGERGYIGFGGPASSHGEHVVRYRLESRKASG